AMSNAKTDSCVQPGDIAKLIGFLVSPACGVVTGAAIPATGRIGGHLMVDTDDPSAAGVTRWAGIGLAAAVAFLVVG
ncbi:hypothetical protein ACC862_38565, partial [Rhizobium ruizarguesonis]